MTRLFTRIASQSHARRALAASALLGLLALVVASCGGGVPQTGVATAGDEVITKKEYNHWLTAAAKGQAAQAPGGAASVPDSPEFKKCIAAKKKTPVPKGTPTPKAAAREERCGQ